MDSTVHEVRLSNWIKIVGACQSRPEGVTQRQWISENGMTRNQYYYWQRKVRKAAYLEQHTDLPQTVPGDAKSATFLELPSENLQRSVPVSSPSGFHADAVIRTGRGEIGIANSISKELLHRIMEEIRHAE